MTHITTRDNTKIFLKDWGSGRPVVLIHGWPLQSDTWDDIAIALVGAGFRTIAYDRRGFGRSDQPWSGYDYDTLADDLADVIEATGAEDAALVGFSMAGGEVARYLSRYGASKITQAVLISSVVPYMLKTDDNPEGTPAETFDQITAAIKKDRPQFLSGFLDSFFGVNLIGHPVSDEYLTWSRTLALQGSQKATLACAQSFATTDFRPDLASFTVPTLIIHGTADKTVPIDAAGRAAAKGITNAKLIEYEGEPHGLYATQRERLIDDLLTFLTKGSQEALHWQESETPSDLPAR